MKSLGVILALSVTAFLSGCSTISENTTAAAEGEQQVPEVPSNYESLIERYSAGDREYSGFYNTFEYRATILNTPTRSVTLRRQANYFQWDRAKQEVESEKSNQEMSSKTVLFVSFFTPERKNDNLTDSKSIWKLYLDAGGQRYEGKAIRSKLLLAELQALYPYHTRWNTAYFFEFPVPTTAIESQETTLTITGPLGTRSVKFPRL